MQFPVTLTALLTLSTLTSGYVITVYTKAGCEGNAEEVNAARGTCADPDGTWRSFRVESYGDKNQRAGFYPKDGCKTDGSNFKDWWADGGSNVFKKGKCIDLSFGVKSFGSRHVDP